MVWFLFDTPFFFVLLFFLERAISTTYLFDLLSTHMHTKRQVHTRHFTDHLLEMMGNCIISIYFSLLEGKMKLWWDGHRRLVEDEDNGSGILRGVLLGRLL